MYKQATEEPRKRHISPHMMKLIKRTNNFFTGVRNVDSEEDEDEDKNNNNHNHHNEQSNFVNELDLKPMTQTKKKKMKKNVFKIDQ